MVSATMVMQGICGGGMVFSGESIAVLVNC